MHTPHRRLEAVKKLILITELQIECAELLQKREAKQSDMGWLLSMVAGPPGTLLAVLKGQSATHWQDVIFQLEEAKTRLLIEASHLERALSEA